MSSDTGKLTFYRQSSWMIAAVTTAGVFMYAVHFPAWTMPRAEYGVFAALLAILNLMMIPSIGLQTIFTQQTAAALDVTRQQQLTGLVRTILFGTFLLWLGAVVIVFIFRHGIIEQLRIQNPAGLWITVLAGLPMLWLPIIQGLLQGRQNFLWLGWIAIFNGFGRFVAVLITVVLLNGHAASGITGALIGMVIALALGLWQTRSLWKGPSLSIDWRPWLARVVPLTIGLAASQFLFAADMIAVQAFFDEDTGLYGAAGTIARGLVVFTGPMVMVMFPKVVQSAARSEETNVLAQALLATAFLGGLAALGCTLFAELPFRIMNKPDYLPITPLIPWFAWSMLPLAVSNVLLNNLLARGEYRVVPWAVGLAVAYAVALVLFGTHFRTDNRFADFRSVVQILGVFNLLFLSLLITFSIRKNIRGR